MKTALEPIDKFLEEELGRWPDADAARRAVRVLRDSAFYGERGMECRRPVISGDGTPVLLSFQENGTADSKPFRFLVEPGLASLSVSEQVDYALHTLERLLIDLQWQSAAPGINAAIECLFPRESAAVASWWGGIGLGCSVDARGLELRVYCNVREGDVQARWTRIGRVLACLGGIENVAEPYRQLIERLSPLALPGGVALCVRSGRIVGVRVYFGVPSPDAPAICEIGILGDDANLALVEELCRIYTEVRPFTFSCVTVGLDFAIPEPGRIDMRPRRFKADFDCTPDPARPCADPAAMTQWLSRSHRLFSLPGDGVQTFLHSMNRIFGRYTVDYVSFGWRGDAREITTYVLPGGYATLK